MQINIPVLLVGAAFLIVGILLLKKELRRKKLNTLSVMAEVTGYHTEIQNNAGNDGTSTVYYPIMRYFLQGQWYEEKSDLGRGGQKYKVGERVELLCNPEKPEDFAIAGDNTSTIVAVIAILLGIGVMVLSFFAD